jgi:hypothetical protein
MVYGYNSHGCHDPMNFVDDQIASILTATPEPGWLDKTMSSSASIIDPSTMCLLADWEINLPTSRLVLCRAGSNNTDVRNSAYDGEYGDCSSVTKNNISDGNKPVTMQASQVSCSSLIHLASYCEQFIFNATNVTIMRIDHLLPKHILSVLAPILFPSSAEELKYYDAHVIIASQFMLQMLEIELCVLLKKHSPGKAPLLKDMVEALGKLDSQQSMKESNPTTTTTTTLRFSSHYCHTLAKVLRALLLPTGLNLRNLIWHGFLCNLHRRWLALSLVILLSIRKLVEEQEPLKQTSNLAEDAEQVQQRFYFEFEPLSRYGASILQAPSEKSYLKKLSEHLIVSSFLPDSYLNLVQTSMMEYNPLYYPACFCTIITPLIEHGIRLLWCKCNDYNHMAFAQMSKYYVTLDGIGQRDRHNLLLLPILDHGGNDFPTDATAITNKLVCNLGAPILSLLADLFLSPCGGPNVRSAVAHGNKMWADALHSELEKKANRSRNRDSPVLERSNDSCNKIDTDCCSTSDNIPQCVAFTLLTVLRLLADKTAAIHEELSEVVPSADDLLPVVPIHIKSYRPCFTHASSFMADVEQCIQNLRDLRTLMLSKVAQCAIDNMSTDYRDAFNALKSCVTTALGSVENLHETLSDARNKILGMFDLLHLVTPRIRGNLSSWDKAEVLEWKEDDLLQEYRLSSIIAHCGAARTLVAEVAVATEQLVKKIEDGLLLLQGEESNQQPRKAKSRISVSFSRQCSIAPHALYFYFFSAYVALCYIDNEVNMNVFNSAHSGMQNDAESERSELLTIVNRSRMAVSTFSTYASCNTERSIKAINTFLSAKSIKKALQKGNLLMKGTKQNTSPVEYSDRLSPKT